MRRVAFEEEKNMKWKKASWESKVMRVNVKDLLICTGFFREKLLMELADSGSSLVRELSDRMTLLTDDCEMSWNGMKYES